MLRIKPHFQNFEEYLSYDDGTDYLYELFNGELIEVPPESGLNVSIAGFLFVQFALMLGHQRVRGHGLELEVRGEPRNRFPDLTIIRETHVQQLSHRNTIRLSMEPPILLVEVVSPGEVQHQRDYVAKRQQYQDAGVPEYWLIDPELQTITVLELQNDQYVEVGRFRSNDRILSPGFPSLNLTAEQVLSAGA
ncbi:MAG: Uma2 family endonuclease [Elainella sp. Prado103]|jgi:Uma2 family endonuclease|nr:Uma2 family endonuclease [Elainella sp. Prado103]